MNQQDKSHEHESEGSEKESQNQPSQFELLGNLGLPLGEKQEEPKDEEEEGSKEEKEEKDEEKKPSSFEMLGNLGSFGFAQEQGGKEVEESAEGEKAEEKGKEKVEEKTSMFDVFGGLGNLGFGGDKSKEEEAQEKDEEEKSSTFDMLGNLGNFGFAQEPGEKKEEDEDEEIEESEESEEWKPRYGGHNEESEEDEDEEEEEKEESDEDKNEKKKEEDEDKDKDEDEEEEEEEVAQGEEKEEKIGLMVNEPTEKFNFGEANKSEKLERGRTRTLGGKQTLRKIMEPFEVERSGADTSPTRSIQADKAYKEKILIDKAEIKHAVNKRKIMRYIAYFTYLGIIATILIIAFNYLAVSQSLTLPASFASGADISLTIDNCTLFILDPPKDSDQSAPVFVKYQVPIQLLQDPETAVKSLTTETSLSVDVRNGVDPLYCLVQLYVQSSTTALGSLQINCQRCNITQDTTSQLQVQGALNISGQVVHSNFRNVKVGSLSYQSITGHLQLNNIESTGDGVSNISMSGEGDIIIQSTQSFLLDATTSTQAFCMSAPNLLSVNNGTCSYSDQNLGQSSTTYSKCNLSWGVCLDSDCDTGSLPTYLVNSGTGNIYANIIPEVGAPVSASKVVSGQIYNSGIDLNPKANEAVQSFNVSLSDEAQKGNPFFILNLGNSQSRSSNYMKWVVSTSPSYALMKPWWMGTLSASILEESVYQTNGFLLPGFCPFFPDYTTQNLLEIQNLIANKVSSLNTLITFVNDQAMPLPPSSHQPNSGIFPLIEKGNPSDNWFSLSLSTTGEALLHDNNYHDKGGIMAAIIVSLVIAAFTTYMILSITLFGINLMYTKLVDFASHITTYSKLNQSRLEKSTDQSKESKKNPLILRASQFSLGNILRNAPSPLAFIDYLSLIIYRQFSSSVVQFYSLLFREANPEEILDQELDPSQDMMRGEEAKLLYEKFCFMNHLSEQKLTDPANLDLLKSYGFEIMTRNDLLTQVFSKIIIENRDVFMIDSSKIDEKINSLDLYLENNVRITEFEEDQIEADTFMKLYNDFCEYNRLPQVTISPSLMKEKYGINLIVVPHQYIIRIKKEEQVNLLGLEQPLLPRARNLWSLAAPSQKHYYIDKTRIENHFNLIMQKLEIMSSEDLEQATLDLILFPGWQAWDALAVFLHLLTGALITLPLILFIILNESAYEPWSVKYSLDLIRFQDILYDPVQLFINLYNGFTWNICLMFVVTILWVMSFLDLILYYAVMEFPQDKSFKRSEYQTQESFIRKISRQLEWIFVLIALAFYIGYISLVLTWLLLGAFINPNAFLPFASAAATFVTFVVTKYRTFKDLALKGTKTVMDYVNTVFQGFTLQLLGKITQNFGKTSKNFSQAKEELIKNKQVESTIDMLKTSGLIDQATLKNYSQTVSMIQAKPGSSETAAGDTKGQLDLVKQTEALESSLREKSIQYIKDECKKRDIPAKFVDLVIAITVQDTLTIQQTMRSLFVEISEKSKSPPERADILMELLFPRSIDKEETITFITKMLVKYAYQKLNLDKTKDLTPDVIIQTLDIFKNIERGDYKSFMDDIFREVFGPNDYISTQEFYFTRAALDTVSILAQKKVDHWNLKDQYFKLLYAAENSYQVSYLIEFMPLLLVGNDPLPEFREISKKVEETSRSLSLYSEKPTTSFIKDLLCFGFTMMKQQAQDLPKTLLTRMEALFEADIPASSTFFPFCLNLANSIYNDPLTTQQHFDRRVTSFGLPDRLEEFIKVVGLYSMEHYEDCYPKINLSNPYFAKISQNTKVDLEGLVGLIDLMYEKKNSKCLDAFIRATLIRRSINQDNQELLKALIILFLSKDDTVLLRVLRTLNLDHGHFLLIGKHLLNPRFVPVSEFEALGIADRALILQKDTIYLSSSDNYEIWKGKIRKNINDHLERTRNSVDYQEPGSMSAAEFKKLELKINLVKFYLSDWNTFSYSKKNLTSVLLALSNRGNNIRKLLDTGSQGRSYSGADYLAAILNVQNLCLTDGIRYANLDKDKDVAIGVLAEYLDSNAEALRNFVQMFVLQNPKDLCKNFLYFFPEEKDHEEEIKRILIMSLDHIATIQKEVTFLVQDLPKSIDLGDPHARLPVNLFKKICYEGVRVDFSVNDLLEFVNFKVKSLKLEPEAREALFMECYALALFSRGLFHQNTIPSSLTPQDTKIQSLISILTEQNLKNRQAKLTELFTDLNHPIKVAIALDGLLTQNSFLVHHNSEYNRLGKTLKSQSIKSYLGDIFKVYPEIFDIFEIIFERDMAKFIERALPIIRRITNSSFVNKNLMENLFSLSVGEHFNPDNLARKIEVSPDTIDFFVSLVRMCKSITNKEELKYIRDSVPFRNGLTKLKIRPNEFFGLSEVIFNGFEDEESTAKVLVDLNLKDVRDERNKKVDLINVDLFEELLVLTKPTNQKLNFFDNKEILTNLKTRSEAIVSSWKLSSGFTSIDPKNIFVISRLASGNFLILEEYKDDLLWIFPVNDLSAQRAILNMTMALSGLLNPNVGVYDELDKDIQAFIDNFYPKGKFSFQEPVHRMKDKILPDNSLAYATYLAYHTIDIIPKWTQVFLFDRKAMNSINARIPDLKVEFLVAMVLQVGGALDIMGDIFGLYEWTRQTIRYYKEKTGNNAEDSSGAKFLRQITDELHRYFEQKMTFDYQQTKDLSSYLEVFQDEHLEKYFIDEKAYNAKVNQSLLYLLTVKDAYRYAKGLESKLREHITKKPLVFLREYAKVAELEILEENQYMIGKLIKKAISRCYKVVGEKFYNNKSRIDGFALTNLSILGTITLLKNVPSMSPQRKLYNLHQVAINIERKMFFEDFLFKMSKFRVMRIAGISAQLHVSNISEWCLPPSLFDPHYVEDLLLAKTEEDRTKRIVERIEAFIYNRTTPDKPLQGMVGDLCFHGGSYDDYCNVMGSILESDGWESLNLLLQIDALYLYDRNAPNVNQVLSTKPNQTLLEVCRKGRLSSAEITTVKFKRDGEEMWYPLLDKVKEIKTGAKYENITNFEQFFEEALMHPTAHLLQGLIRGDPYSVLQKGHVLAQGDPERAKICAALLALQSYNSRQKKDRRVLKSCLGILASKIQSDGAKIFELLSFITSQKGTLNETMNALQIPENIVEFLLIALEEEMAKDEDREKPFDLREIVSETLEDVPEDFIEAFELIRTVYLIKDQDAWIRLIERMRKSEGRKQGEDLKHDNHPLMSLIQLLSFEKLKEQVCKGDKYDRSLLNSLKSGMKDELDRASLIFKEVILGYSPYKNFSDEQKVHLLEEHHTIQLLQKMDMSSVLEIVILEKEGKKYLNKGNEHDDAASLPKDHNQKAHDLVKSEPMLDRLLRLFGVNSKDSKMHKDVTLLQLFLALSQNNLASFKAEENYQTTTQRLIQSLIEVGALNSLQKDLKSKQKVSQLLLGMVGWDFEYCIKAFAENDTIHEGYLLYNLYGCLNVNKLLSLDEQNHDQAHGYIKAILPFVFGNILSKFYASECGVDPKKDNQANMMNEFNLKDLNDAPNTMEERAQNLFTRLDECTQTKPLAHFIDQAFEKDINDPLSTGKNFKTFADLICSICDGTLLVKLINTFMKNISEQEIYIPRTIKKLFILNLQHSQFCKKQRSKKDVSTAFYTLLKLIRDSIYDRQTGQDTRRMWDRLLEIGPEIFTVWLLFQREGRMDIEKSTAKALKIIKKSISYTFNDKQTKIIFGLMTTMLGVEEKHFGKTKGQICISYNLELEARMKIFNESIKAFIPTVRQEIQQGFYIFTVKLRTNFSQAMEDQERRFKAVKGMWELLEKFSVISDAPKALMELLEGDLDKSENNMVHNLEHIYFFKVKQEMYDYMKKATEMLRVNLSSNAEPVKFTVSEVKPQQKIDPENWALMLKKIKEGTASSGDLFRMVDMEGDQSGSINETEFSILTNRLGLKLSSHRIKEIFAKVKTNKIQSSSASVELNEQEFEKALGYLQEKNLQEALQLLGITPEILTAILVRLVILLILIFIFIFLGIETFAVGGTFGVLINSVFPAVGGVALSKESDAGKGKLDEQKVKDAADTGFEITASEQL